MKIAIDETANIHFSILIKKACRVLLSYGCDTTIVSLQGYTAAQLATESVAKILAEEPVHQTGADIEYQLLEAAKAGKSLQKVDWKRNTSIYKTYTTCFLTGFVG